MARVQKGFLFDSNRCLGCRSCVMACATGNDLPPGIYLRNIEMQEFKKGNQITKYFTSTSCNHCANPECLRLCPNQAFQKRQDGIVMHNSTKCDGCGTCTRGCPFEAPVIDSISGKVVKCDLCYDRLDEKETPFCITACPVQAIQLVDISQINSRGLATVRRLHGAIRIQITQPSIRYVSLRSGKQILRHPKEKGDMYEDENLQ